MNIIKINEIEIKCDFVFKYDEIVELKDQFACLRKKYRFEKIKVVIANKQEAEKAWHAIKSLIVCIEVDSKKYDYYISTGGFGDQIKYIEKGFLDIDFVPTHPNMVEII
jgi:hypothetical protein